jgi:hypothetical protein
MNGDIGDNGVLVTEDRPSKPVQLIRKLQVFFYIQNSFEQNRILQEYCTLLF